MCFCKHICGASCRKDHWPLGIPQCDDLGYGDIKRRVSDVRICRKDLSGMDRFSSIVYKFSAGYDIEYHITCHQYICAYTCIRQGWTHLHIVHRNIHQSFYSDPFSSSWRLGVAEVRSRGVVRICGSYGGMQFNVCSNDPREKRVKNGRKRAEKQKKWRKMRFFLLFGLTNEKKGVK